MTNNNYFYELQEERKKIIEDFKNQINSSIPCYLDFELDSYYLTLEYTNIGFFRKGFDLKKKNTNSNKIPFKLFFVLKNVYENNNGLYTLEGFLEDIMDSSKKLVLHKSRKDVVSFRSNNEGDLIQLDFLSENEVNISTRLKNNKTLYFWGFKNNVLGAYKRRYKADTFEIYFDK